jgi:hypothetical protein
MFSDRQFLIDAFQKQQRVCPFVDIIGRLDGVGAKRPEIKKLINGVILKHNSSTGERRVSGSRECPIPVLLEAAFPQCT